MILQENIRPQFHLHALGNPHDSEIVLFRLPFCQNFTKLDLKWLRLVFFFINLVVLLTAVVAFQSWIKIDSIKHEATKGLTQRQKDR